jgi:hypothetical protein
MYVLCNNNDDVKHNGKQGNWNQATANNLIPEPTPFDALQDGHLMVGLYQTINSPLPLF